MLYLLILGLFWIGSLWAQKRVKVRQKEFDILEEKHKRIYERLSLDSGVGIGEIAAYHYLMLVELKRWHWFLSNRELLSNREIING